MCATTTQQRAHCRFHEAVGPLLREHQGLQPMQGVNVAAIAEEMGAGWSYEYVRLLLKGQRRPKAKTMVRLSEILGIAPEHFREYRIHQLDQLIDKRPELVDAAYDQAMQRAAELDAEEARSRK